MNTAKLIIKKFINGTISSEERNELKKWISENEDHLKVFEEAIVEHNKGAHIPFDADKAHDKFLSKIKREKRISPISRFYKVAAVLILLFVGASTYLIQKKSTQTENVYVDNNKTESQKNDSQITLTLPDGTVKTIHAGTFDKVIDTKKNIIATGSEQALSFNATPNNSDNSTPNYNEIHIPKGQTYKVQLADGTLVWLNASSTLKFPQDFNTLDNRLVYLEGEAYFEVTPNKEQPFIVDTQGVQVEVLGTKFNVSSYDSDDFIATTLLEGSVNVKEVVDTENQLILTPEHQAYFTKDKHYFDHKKVDVNLSLAWMQNKLIIHNQTFAQILKKLERAHNVTFINNYKTLDTVRFKGSFENESIESILNTISLSTPFTYERNENTIVITK